MSLGHVLLTVTLLVSTGCIPRRPFPPAEPPSGPVASAGSSAGVQAGAEIANSGDDDQPASTGCVRFWPEARLRSYAYDHVVHVGSSCARVASCTVATNLSPTPIVVAVPPNEVLEVVTLRGSEAAEFTPLVQCSRGTR